MLDKRCAHMLAVINKMCREGSFQVFETKDLISFMPNKWRFDNHALEQTLSFLCRENYVDIKYQDAEVVCLSPLPKGRHFCETRIEEMAKKRKTKRTIAKLLIGVFLLSVLGSMLGSFLFSHFRLW